MRRGAVALLAVLSACELSTDADREHRSGRIMLQNTQNMPPARRPFVTILDSAEVTIVRRRDGTRLHYLAKGVTPADTVVAFPLVTLPDDELIFTGRLLATQYDKIALSQGAETTRVDPEGSPVTVDVTPILPILLVSPDTVKYIRPTTGSARDSVFVYNRGAGSMRWRIVDVTPPLTLPACRLVCMLIQPDSGLVPAGDVQIVRLERIAVDTIAFRLTFSTSYGQVPVIVRRAP